ncbi:hypothetical protein F4083_09335 [Candidatus Poribacteria bacterium]|nr:hypothetical protein [Candidatus Poribacteria bacterium]MYI94506.1 hypothetical protein [Candidatus Poribacteria bacterium]
MKKYAFLLCFTLLTLSIFQIEALSVDQTTETKRRYPYPQESSAATDTAASEENYPLFRTHRKQYYPELSTRKATILSATMPGLGQAYADNYLKATLFLASEIGVFSYASYHIARSLHYRNHNKFNTGFYDERAGGFLTDDQVKARSVDHAIQGSLFVVVGIGIHVWNIMDASKTAEAYNNRRISVQMQQTNSGSRALVFNLMF